MVSCSVSTSCCHAAHKTKRVSSKVSVTYRAAYRPAQRARMQALNGRVAAWAAADPAMMGGMGAAGSASTQTRLALVREELTRRQAESKKHLQQLVQSGRMVPAMAYIKMDEVTHVRSSCDPSRRQ